MKNLRAVCSNLLDFIFIKNVTLHISHVFYDNYTRISAPPWHESPGVLCHFLPSASGGITRQGYRVISGKYSGMSPSKPADICICRLVRKISSQLVVKYFIFNVNATNCHFTCQFDIWQVDIITCILQVDEIIWHVDMKI